MLWAIGYNGFCNLLILVVASECQVQSTGTQIHVTPPSEPPIRHLARRKRPSLCPGLFQDRMDQQAAVQLCCGSCPLGCCLHYGKFSCWHFLWLSFSIHMGNSHHFLPSASFSSSERSLDEVSPSPTPWSSPVRDSAPCLLCQPWVYPVLDKGHSWLPPQASSSHSFSRGKSVCHSLPESRPPSRSFHKIQP